ncbi:DNA-directed RNA polymerase [Thermoplasma acidophilum]|uniref:DNA-directed RNA polymerase n=1 Tax=Thermoplasma acidophilum TaxID=2303 RepID=UPI00001660B7
MYMLVEDKYIARVPPEMLGEDYDVAVREVTKRSLEGRLVDVINEKTSQNEGKYLVISVLYTESIGEGTIVHGDGGVYQEVKYRALVYYPEMQEIVDGEVVSVQKFGAFIKFSSFEGLLHISQIMDDRIDIDLENKRFIGKETKRDLKVGDRVRVRIVAMNLASSSISDSKIGFTMKQVGLGKLDWLAKEASQ